MPCRAAETGYGYASPQGSVSHLTIEGRELAGRLPALFCIGRNLRLIEMFHFNLPRTDQGFPTPAIKMMELEKFRWQSRLAINPIGFPSHRFLESLAFLICGKSSRRS